VLIVVVKFVMIINPLLKGGTVKKGKTPGIYNTWNKCKAQVDGFSGAEYKSFKSEQEAISIINDVAALIERTYKKVIK